jgi:hypothetical protein
MTHFFTFYETSKSNSVYFTDSSGGVQYNLSLPLIPRAFADKKFEVFTNAIRIIILKDLPYNWK